MLYDALAELLGASVTDVNDDCITFSNGLKIVCQDISDYIDISEYRDEVE